MAAIDPTVYGASWYAANSVAAPARGRLTIELDVDICVIGGGLAGLTVALEAARRGWSVAVLEARRVAWNASGRNTGFVLPGFAADPRALIEKAGGRQAKALWALSVAGVDYVRRTIRETKMRGVEAEEGGWLYVSKTDDDNRLAQYVDLLAGEFGTTAELWPAERVRSQLRSATYFSGVHIPDAFAMNPLNYALGLAAAAEAAGARIFEETPALEIDPAGVRKRITTPLARLRAGHVVLAGNVHIGGLVPRLAATLVPIWTYSIVTQPLGEKLRDAISFRGMVTDNRLGDSDYRVVGGDRLLWADRCTAWEGEPRRYARALVANLRRIYPQLGEVEAEFAWTGMLGNTVHSMPQIGEVLQGVWLLSGFGGHGINTTAMGGDLVARAIIEGNPTWKLFSPFELVWAGGKLGRAAVQSYYWYFRAREGIEAWLSRRRHPAALLDTESGAPVVPDVEPSATFAAEPAKRKRRRRKAKSGVHLSS